jgi:hypothetical protein
MNNNNNNNNNNNHNNNHYDNNNNNNNGQNVLHVMERKDEYFPLIETRINDSNYNVNSEFNVKSRELEKEIDEMIETDILPSNTPTPFPKQVLVIKKNKSDSTTYHDQMGLTSLELS